MAVPPPPPYGPNSPASSVGSGPRGRRAPSEEINLHDLPPPAPEKKNRKLVIGIATLMTVLLVAIAIAVGVVISNNNNSATSGAGNGSSLTESGSSSSNALPEGVEPGTLQLMKQKYYVNEDVQIKFTDPTPHADHWIGITLASAPEEYLTSSNVVDWKFACGTQTCTEILDEGKITISKKSLEPGRYQAYLFANSKEPYPIIASTKPFTVEDVKDDASSQKKPTSKPTFKPTLRQTNKPTSKPTKAPTPITANIHGIIGRTDICAGDLERAVVCGAKNSARPHSCCAGFECSGQASGGSAFRCVPAGTGVDDTSPAAPTTEEKTVATTTPTPAEPIINELKASKDQDGNALESVIVSKYNSYSERAVVEISFANAEADAKDRVVIAPAGSESGEIFSEADKALWVYTCGSTDCMRAVQFGTVTIGAQFLKKGQEWQAYLLEPNENGDFFVKAMSDPFKIHEELALNDLVEPKGAP